MAFETGVRGKLIKKVRHRHFAGTDGFGKAMGVAEGVQEVVIHFGHPKFACCLRAGVSAIRAVRHGSVPSSFFALDATGCQKSSLRIGDAADFR